MLPEYDILIAGAGPAGCAAAYDLARAGRRVLLLDKRSFPRPKACACGLTRKTLAALRYSVAPVTERVCHEIVLQNNPGAPGPSPLGTRDSTEVRIRTRSPICAMAVRERFDAFCLQQTLAAGASLKKIESIVALRETADGIELDITTASGAETLRAPVLIGADGSNGQTRRLALGGPSFPVPGVPGGGSLPAGVVSERVGSEPAWYTRGFALEACVPYTDLPATLPGGGHAHDLVFDFAPLRGGYGWLFPKGDHINVGVGAFAPTNSGAPGPGSPASASGRWGGDPDSRTRDSQDARLKSVTRALLTGYAAHKLGVRDLPHITGQHLGMGGHAYVPRGRVLLAGDAAGLCDPLTGEGIHSAIVSGQAAAAAILEALPNPALKGKGFSPSVDPHRGKGASAPEGTEAGDLAASYAHHLRPLQQTLAFSHRAARAFYTTPERGFRAMRTPLLRSLILKTYADGLPYTRLLNRLVRLVA